MKIFYGLDALPRGLSLDDPRLPCVTLDPAALRLNTHPVPPPILAEAGSGHTAHVAAMSAWLLRLAGDWAAGRRRLLADYLAQAAAELERETDAISHRAARYHGLYTPDDYFWSALRPLPRAWIVTDDAAPIFADLALWDGQTVHAAGLRGSGDERVVPFAPNAWPEAARGFWRDTALPSSPFRRPPISPPIRASVP